MDNMTLADIGRRIRSRRHERGRSQEQLALAAKLSQPAIARIERGQVNPQWDSLERISAALGSGICELLCGRARQSDRASKLAGRAAAILDSRDDLAITLLLNGFDAAEGVLSRAPARRPRRRRPAGAKKLAVRQPAADPGYGMWQTWRDED
jgi:transcriptional regulator with XRE-family HTH domain